MQVLGGLAGNVGGSLQLSDDSGNAITTSAVPIAAAG